MKSPLVLTLVLTVSILFASGCTQEPGLLVGKPVEGDLYVYRGNDGSEMTVRVLGIAERSDGGGRLHESRILEYRWRAASSEAIEVPIEEAVDTTDGRHVRHDVLCEVNPAYWTCREHQEIYFMAYGLPGGLGVAPWWGEELHAGRLMMPGGLMEEDDTIVAEAQWMSWEDLECLRIEATDPDALTIGAWKPITSAIGPRVVCPGDALPRQWTPDQSLPENFVPGDTRPTFTLVEVRETGQARAILASKSPPQFDRSIVDGPLALLPDAKPWGGMDARSAHERLLAMDKDYAAFWGEGTAIVSYAYFNDDGGRQTALFREEYTIWTIRLAHPEGSQYEATIRQIDRNHRLDGQSKGYEIVESGPHAERLDVVPDPSADAKSPNLPYVYGEEVLGQAADGAYHRFLVRDPTWERRAVEDRFFSRTLYTPPDTPPDQWITQPFIIDTDSKTGWVTYIRLPSDLRMSA